MKGFELGLLIWWIGSQNIFALRGEFDCWIDWPSNPLPEQTIIDRGGNHWTTVNFAFKRSLGYDANIGRNKALIQKVKERMGGLFSETHPLAEPPQKRSRSASELSSGRSRSRSKSRSKSHSHRRRRRYSPTPEPQPEPEREIKIKAEKEDTPMPEAPKQPDSAALFQDFYIRRSCYASIPHAALEAEFGCTLKKRHVKGLRFAGQEWMRARVDGDAVEKIWKNSERFFKMARPHGKAQHMGDGLCWYALLLDIYLRLLTILQCYLAGESAPPRSSNLSDKGQHCGAGGKAETRSGSVCGWISYPFFSYEEAAQAPSRGDEDRSNRAPRSYGAYDVFETKADGR